MLYDTYRNKIRSKKYSNIITKETFVTKEDILKKNISSTVVSGDIEKEMLSCKNWLLHHMDPPDEILKKWIHSFNLRRREILEKKTNIFLEWPLFCKSNAKFFVSNKQHF